MHYFLFKCEDGAQRDLKMLALNTGVTRPQAKKCWKPLEVGRRKEGILPKVPLLIA